MIKKVLRLVLFVFLIIFIVRIDLKELLVSLRSINIYLLSLLSLMQIITIILTSYQWHILIDRASGENNFFTSLEINIRGNIVDGITPGSKVGGELYRAMELKESFSLDKKEALLIVLKQKIISISTFVIIFFISYLLKEESIILLARRFFLFLILFLFLSLIIIYTFRKKLYKIFRLTSKSYRNFRSLRKQIIISIIIWIFYGLKLELIGNFYNLSLDIMTIFFIAFASYSVGILPILPGGIGSFELTMSSLLYGAGIDLNRSSLIAIIFRFSSFWLEIIIGIVFIITTKFFKSIKDEKCV